MTEAIQLVAWAEQYFDCDKMEHVYGYLPAYDFVVDYCKKHGVKMYNPTGSSLDWEISLTKDQVLDILRVKYRRFYKGETCLRSSCTG